MKKEIQGFEYTKANTQGELELERNGLLRRLESKDAEIEELTAKLEKYNLMKRKYEALEDQITSKNQELEKADF